MNRPPHGTTRAGRSLAAAVLATAAVLLSTAWVVHLASDSAAGWSGWAWLASLSFGAVCATAAGLWVHKSLAAQLREARLEQQALSELAEAWLWRTDTQHRLTHWRPPQAAPASAWREEPQALPCLWQRFEVLDGLPQPGALRGRLEAHAAISGLRVRWLGSPANAAWRLRALPQFDSHGQFTGYVGSAVPLSMTEQRRFDQSLLGSLWAELDMPAMALRAGTNGWQVAALSPAAARLMKLSTAPDCDWTSAAARLPPEVASAVQGLQPGQQIAAGHWTAQLIELTPGEPDESLPGGAGRLLLLRPPASAATEDPLSAGDQESFAYSVSHDLRAPIRVVEGFARILKEDYGRFLDRIGNDHVDRVLAAAARMNSMIDALLALSRLQSQPLARKPVDLSQLATFILEDLRSEAPDRQATLQIEPGIVVSGDPTLLRIALENLLGNAWKYSSQASQTSIEFRREQRDGQSVLVVADKGAGFDMRFADRLFGVFQRLHSAKDFQGTGVGLASVKRILRRHGGDIWAESEVGKGARFYFTIPS